MKVIKQVAEYSTKHEYEIKETDLYCPRCGSKPVYQVDHAGCYYLGEDHLCFSCNGEFTLPTLHNIRYYTRVE